MREQEKKLSIHNYIKGSRWARGSFFICYLLDRRRYWCIPFFQSSLNKFKSIMDQMCCLGATCLAQCIVWMFEEVLKQTIIWGSSVHLNKKAGWAWSSRISISFKQTYVHSIFSISDYIMCRSNESLGFNLWPEKWL